MLQMILKWSPVIISKALQKRSRRDEKKISTGDIKFAIIHVSEELIS